MPAKKTLVVLVPGHWGDPASMRPLRDLLSKDSPLQEFVWLEFAYKEPVWSNKRLEIVAQNLADTIDAYFHRHADEVEQIILLGHSMGSVVLRRAFLNAIGSGREGSGVQTWSERVSRLVLIGAFGRGFDPRKTRGFSNRYLKVTIGLGALLGIGGMRRDIVAGSDFMSRLRVDWIAFNRLDRMKPVVVHLLGSNDEFVGREDVIDLEQFPNAIAIGVPDATHADVVVPKPSTIDQMRRAFTALPSMNHDVPMAGGTDRIYFLLHGIRDSRGCFKQVADLLEERSPDAKIIVPTYGYLSARGFLSARYRNRFVSWFVDQVSEQMARNPYAKFYFAGHSNGTYILGESLKRIPRMTFEHVYIAASVLPVEYEWGDAIEKNEQVKFVRSDMGTEDWPVGVLCRVLNKLGKKEIGPGGFDEFEYGDRDHIAYNRFVGGHGAMLTADNAESIVDYLLSGESTKTADPETKEVSRLFGVFKKYGDILLPMILALLLLGLCLLLAMPWLFPTMGFAMWAPLVAAVLVVAGWIVTGRF